MVCEVAERHKAEFDPELLKHYEQAGLQMPCAGGGGPQSLRLLCCRHGVQTEWPRAPQAI